LGLHLLHELEAIGKLQVGEASFASAGQTRLRTLSGECSDIVPEPEAGVHLVVGVEIYIIAQAAVAVIRWDLVAETGVLKGTAALVPTIFDRVEFDFVYFAAQ